MAYQQGSKLYIAGRDMSADWTALAFTVGREAIENTRGGDTTRIVAPALWRASLEAEGALALGADSLEEELYADVIDLSDTPIIVTPGGSTAGADGGVAYGFEANVGDFSPLSGSRIGDRVEFSVSARCAGRPVRGTIMHSANATRAATGNGTARQLGAVTAAQKLYACIQVISATGTNPTLDVVIASDNAEGFPSGTTRATFTQKTAAGQYEWVEVDGAITDDWWRVQATLGGTNPVFGFVVLLAIH